MLFHRTPHGAERLADEVVEVLLAGKPREDRRVVAPHRPWMSEDLRATMHTEPVLTAKVKHIEVLGAPGPDRAIKHADSLVFFLFCFSGSGLHFFILNGKVVVQAGYLRVRACVLHFRCFDHLWFQTHEKRVDARFVCRVPRPKDA